MTHEEMQTIRAIMQETIRPLENRFDKLEGRFDNLEGRFDTLEGSFKELNAKVESMQSDICEIKEDISEIKEEAKVTRAATNYLVEQVSEMQPVIDYVRTTTPFLAASANK